MSRTAPSSRELPESGATGVLQSALGNLPELLVCVFSLRAGLLEVVQAALIGSILANSLLVLGVAIVVGGVKHGRMRFDSESPRMIASMMFVAVAALAFPTFAAELHTPAASHERELSAACAILLLIVYVASLRFTLSADPERTERHAPRPPRRRTLAPVDRDHGAGDRLGRSGGRVGVVRVRARAGDSDVTHLSGVRRNCHRRDRGQRGRERRRDSAHGEESARLCDERHLEQLADDRARCHSALVLLSFVLGGAVLTLVLPPLLIAALLLTTLTSAIIVNDGETIWVEGVALIGLYCIIAASFWWG